MFARKGQHGSGNVIAEINRRHRFCFKIFQRLCCFAVCLNRLRRIHDHHRVARVHGRRRCIGKAESCCRDIGVCQIIRIIKRACRSALFIRNRTQSNPCHIFFILLVNQLARIGFVHLHAAARGRACRNCHAAFVSARFCNRHAARFIFVLAVHLYASQVHTRNRQYRFLVAGVHAAHIHPIRFHGCGNSIAGIFRQRPSRRVKGCVASVPVCQINLRQLRTAICIVHSISSSFYRTFQGSGKHNLVFCRLCEVLRMILARHRLTFHKSCSICYQHRIRLHLFRFVKFQIACGNRCHTREIVTDLHGAGCANRHVA